MFLLLFSCVIHALAAVPATVADAAAVGDCAAVVQSLPNPSSADQRLVAGRCLRRLGRHDQADQVLQPVTTGVFGDYARHERALALAAAGRPDAAIEAIDGLSLPGPFGTDLRLLRDRLLVESHRSLEARDDLRALLDTSLADEARWWLAVGGEDRGERDAAIATYRRLWATSVRGPWASKASERLNHLGAPVPDAASAEGQALMHDRIAALRAANQNEAALALARMLPAPTTGPARLARARLLFDARATAEARDLYRAVLGPPEAATGTATDLFEYALATARAGDYDAATVIYRRCEAQHPETESADFAGFKIGYMLYDRGDLAGARVELNRYAQRRPGGKHVEEALWFSARAAWRLGDTAVAVQEFRQLTERFPSSGLVPGAEYWQARAITEPSAAKSAMEALIREHPTSGHAWFAADRIGKSFPRQARVSRPAWPATLATRADVQRAEALLSIGFRREAKAELAGIQKVVSGDRAGALAAAHALIAAGDYQGGQRLARPYCVPAWERGDPVAQQACTPMPEATVVAQVAEKFDLHRLLPFGIMTAESGLDPTVTSIAGARGLMQVMPAELERIHAEVFGAGPVDPDDLYSAPYAAAIGTGELGLKSRSLTGVLDGPSLPAIIASYNGGEAAVRRWVAAYPRPPAADEFAEDVSYTETRRYVKRVLGYVMAYRWVYGD